MVTAAALELLQAGQPDMVVRVSRLAAAFGERAAAHDRDASFPFENFRDLSEAGLLSLTVPAALGGTGQARAKPRACSASSARPILRPRWCCRCTISSI
jgi:alkylation response protein AidB-like acyl-CoA dehydrogenase